jgi:hypothetical protein
MANLTFKNVGVLRVVEHAMAAKKHAMGYGHEGDAVPCLTLVKDDGIYLMSNGKPGDPDETWCGPSPKLFVVYADGYEADRSGVWDKCRAAVGGDDFAEYLELTPELTKDIRDGCDVLLKVSKTRLEVLTMETGV